MKCKFRQTLPRTSFSFSKGLKTDPSVTEPPCFWISLQGKGTQRIREPSAFSRLLWLPPLQPSYKPTCVASCVVNEDNLFYSAFFLLIFSLLLFFAKLA